MIIQKIGIEEKRKTMIIKKKIEKDKGKKMEEEEKGKKRQGR